MLVDKGGDVEGIGNDREGVLSRILMVAEELLGVGFVGGGGRSL